MLHLTETGLLPLILGGLTAVLWASAAIQNVILFRRFRAKYPEIAAQEIPEAFSLAAHPEKAIFFFRQRCKQLLSTDPPLLRKRRLFVAMCIASMVFPLVWFVPLFLFAALRSHN